MPQYIALLRGINVSGHKLIKMAELKELLMGIGFKNVQTYIQSGNVVFESDEKSISNLELYIMSGISGKYGFYVEVMVRTVNEFSRIVETNPFPDAEGNKLYITFFREAPQNIPFEELNKVKSESEVYLFHDRIMFFYCPEGYGITKLSNPFIEKKLKTVATTRNMNTIVKLLGMAQ
ncbi:MAG: DUF1697 domain-containing protein [Ignavibacteriales bacterium]|nr:DUF1697 domain-containing protein [Ignavibacteriales bacterium]